MTTFLRIGSVSFVIVAAAAIGSDAFAQAAAPAGPDVVLLDVAKVFKEHAAFNQALDQMKKDVESFEGYIRQEREKITQMSEQIKQFQVGSADYKRVEKEVAQGTTDLQVKAQLKRKDFMEREAKSYYETYIDVQQKVAAFAERNNIAIVQRFNSEPIKADDRNSVLQGVNQAIVYQKNRDITSYIIRAVNPAPSSAKGTGGNPISR